MPVSPWQAHGKCKEGVDYAMGMQKGEELYSAVCDGGLVGDLVRILSVI